MKVWGRRSSVLTNHYHESKDVVQNDPKWPGKVFKSSKVWTLHNAIGHRLQYEARHLLVVIYLIHANESLQEPDHHDDEQGEEDERFLHHDFQHHEHGAEEAEGVQIKEQAHPEHRRREGKEVV